MLILGQINKTIQIRIDVPCLHITYITEQRKVIKTGFITKFEYFI